MEKKRLQKEIMQLVNNPPEGIKLCQDSSESLEEVKVELVGAKETLYDGEVFQILFKFSDKYPFDSPQVTFVGTNIPLHPHVYSNGHICLSILTEGWTPALGIETVCLSLISMLSSCKEKKLPPGNDMYVRRASSNPKNTRWLFDDDTV